MGRPVAVEEHTALEQLQVALTAHRLPADLDTGLGLPVLFIPIPHTHGRREMVFVSGAHFVWDASLGHYPVDDPAGAARTIARDIARC